MLKFQSDLKQYKTAQTQLEKQPNSRTRSLFTAHCSLLVNGYMHSGESSVALALRRESARGARGEPDEAGGEQHGGDAQAQRVPARDRRHQRPAARALRLRLPRAARRRRCAALHSTAPIAVSWRMRINNCAIAGTPERPSQLPACCPPGAGLELSLTVDTAFGPDALIATMQSRALPSDRRTLLIAPRQRATESHDRRHSLAFCRSFQHTASGFHVYFRRTLLLLYCIRTPRCTLVYYTPLFSDCR